MKNETSRPTTSPIQISIKNISNKIYENISIFDYKKATTLIYSSINEPHLSYEDILRFLTSMRLDDEKKIDSIYISATSDIKENQKNQLSKNRFVYKVVSLAGMCYETPANFPESELEELNYVWIPVNNWSLYSRSNILLGILYPYTTIDILIYPTEETKFF